MQKGFKLVIPITLLILTIGTINLNAQSLTYTLIGQYELATETPDTLEFTPHLPDGFEFCKIEFDVTSETLITNQVYVFDNGPESFEATLYYIATGGSCSTPADLLTQTITIYPKRAHFILEYDKEFEELASLKRILKSSLDISDNAINQLGDFRFFWDFDAKMLPAPQVDFDANNPSLGQYPNVYYTFPNGGAYEITLKVIDINNATDTAAFTMITMLGPEFGSDLVDFEYIPNVFTPTGNSNNFFTVESSGTNKLSFKVFSRSGSLVYQYEGNIIKWDGKNYYGTYLPQGIYYYLLEDISPEKRYNTAKGFFYIYR